MKTTWKMIMWLVGSMLLVSVLAGYSFSIFSQAIDAAQTRQQAHRVLNKADDLLSAIKDAETGQRGYLLTGNEAFLEPYESKRQMDSIRASMKAFVVLEESATQQSDAKFLASVRYLFNLIVAASLLMLLSAMYFVYMIYWRNQQQLAPRAHDETTRLLDLQQQLNQALEEKNTALKIAHLAAEKADRTKSGLLATMSHEIRTPMNGVIGMIDVLQQSSLNGAQMEMTNINANKLDVESIPMSAGEVVESACDNLAQIAWAKQVGLTLFVDPAIPTTVLGDPGRLRQILVNLANNAIKFSAGQKLAGRVSVGVFLKEGTAERAMLTFRVTDNGIGMDKATRARLFNAFTQADTSTTRNFGGTGLGLAISAQWAKLMGGDIGVDSQPGEGSVFSLTLPFVLGPEPSAPTGNPNLIDALPCLVIATPDSLADDLAVYLHAEQALVSRATDPASALAWMQAHPGGLCIVVETTAPDPVLASLRTATRAHPDQYKHFLCLRYGRRRKPRMDQTGLVTVDSNLLKRETFLRAVAIAAGRAQEPDRDNLPAKASTMAAPYRANRLAAKAA